ncbi:MAG TPA: hypothetical protein VEA80_03590 [Vitreimonas sp.]|uniref:hypothetical protein n=1 Tax=Vitreimonas sp. TaxID=3069702 RepID=UPI002D740D47|nr:hypothetical protein [Vitreimonas sp.]HYD86532.1 hypothetical protein [Vitreimonas sp.]
MPFRFTLIAAFACAACSSAPPRELPPPELPQRAGVDPLVAARAEGVEFRGVGEGFVLEIMREDVIRLTQTASGETLTFAKPEPQLPRWNGSIYATTAGTHELYVAIRNDRPCERADRAVYPIRVEIRLDDRVFTGCGRGF